MSACSQFRHVVSDLDGTLLDGENLGGQISEPTKSVLRKIIGKPCPLVLATARGLHELSCLEGLPSPLHLLLYGGAACMEAGTSLRKVAGNSVSSTHNAFRNSRRMRLCKPPWWREPRLGSFSPTWCISSMVLSVWRKAGRGSVSTWLLRTYGSTTASKRFSRRKGRYKLLPSCHRMQMPVLRSFRKPFLRVVSSLRYCQGHRTR